MALKLEIPVGAAFERRLAELVWEHCPELARQTAAGRIALAIDVTDKAVIKEATTKAVEHAVSQIVDPLIEASRVQLEESGGALDVMQRAKELLDERLRDVNHDLAERVNRALNDFMHLFISKNVHPEVVGAVNGFFNDRPIARRVGEVLNQMIKEHLSERLEREKSGSGVLKAAESELLERASDEKGKTNDRQ